MDQLNGISPGVLGLLDKDGIAIYNSSFNDKSQIVYQQPIVIDSMEVGTLVGYPSNGVIKEKFLEFMKNSVEMLEDRIKLEMESDSLALEVINNYQEMNLFYELSETLSSVLDVKTICDVVLKRAVEIIGVNRAYIMLLDKNKEQLTISASTNKDKSLKGLQIKLENSVYECVIKNGVSIVVDDMEKCPELKGKIKTDQVITSIPFICAPIKAEDDIFGLIIMLEKSSGKPFTSVDTKLLCSIALQAGMSLGNARLYDELNNSFLNTVEALAAAVEAKDPHMHGHCRRVAEYAENIGQELGLPAKELMDIRLAGILHDVGKIGISESILKKSTGLSQEDMEEVKIHPIIGADIIEHVESMKNVAEWIRHHHERYDGSGYPDGLAGEDISIHSRILSVADAYDNLTTARTYHSKYPYDIPLVKLQISSGSKFDPEIVNIFLNMLREGAYREYLKKHQDLNLPPDTKLSRVAYYRIDSEIKNILTQEASGYELSESEQNKLQELRELILR